MTSPLPTWIGYLHEADSHREALNLIAIGIDDMLLDGEFEEVGRILSEVDPLQLPKVLQIGFFTMTSPAKHLLPSRQKFLERVEEGSRTVMSY